MSTTTAKNGLNDRVGRPGASESAGAHGGRQLLDRLERLVRASPERAAGWALLALHLSRIPPPGVREHHRRVAGAVLADAAARGDGTVFPLGNGDLVLLFRPAGGAAALLAVVGRLFRTAVADEGALRTLWRLPEEAAGALAYATGRVQEADGTREGERAALTPEPQGNTGAVAAMDEIVQSGVLSDLMHRQTAVLLRPGQAVPIVPLFREVAISTAVLEQRIVGGHATADPFLFSHLAARLDRRMLSDLRTDVPAGGLLSMGLGAAALHINMTVAGILSQAFAHFATACLEALGTGLRIGVEVPFVEAFSDVTSFILARERLRLAKLQLILDGVSHHALLATSPRTLGPALVKLSWSTAMPATGPRLDEAIASLGPERVVLHRSDSDAAIAWGLARGITRFQGRYVDAMLAAERLRACAAGGSCSVGQCRERASATGPAGRAGCRNLGLLDLGAPLYAAVRARPAAMAGVAA